MNLIKKGKVFTSIATAILIGALAVIPFITAKAADGDYQAVSIMVNTFSETTKQGLASITYELYAAENIKDATGSIVIAKDTKLKSAVTNADGCAVFSLSIPMGKYYAKQSTCPKGYQKQDFKIYYQLKAGEVYYSNNVYLPSQPDSLTLNVNAPAGVTSGYDHTLAVSDLSNDSAKTCTNFVYTQNMPFNTSVKSMSTGVYSSDASISVFYTTNKKSDYQTLATVSALTNSNLTFNGLDKDEYVTTVIMSFGNVPAGFKATTKPQFIVNVGADARYGDLLSADGKLSGFFDGKKVSTASTSTSTVISTTTLYTNTKAKDNSAVNKVNEAANEMASSEGYTVKNNPQIESTNNTPADNIATGDATPINEYSVALIICAVLAVGSLVSMSVIQKKKKALISSVALAE